MKTLYLLRHAEAENPKAGQSDAQRVLTSSGEKDMSELAARLAKSGLRFDVILCSPAERTKQTAAIMAAATGFDPSKIEYDPKLYNATAETMIYSVSEVEDFKSKVLLVAHNPGISQLAHLLVEDVPTSNFSPGGICGISFSDLDSWQDADPDEASFLFYTAP